MEELSKIINSNWGKNIWEIKTRVAFKTLELLAKKWYVVDFDIDDAVEFLNKNLDIVKEKKPSAN